MVGTVGTGFPGSQWIAEIEKGESGTIHLQGYVEFPTRVRPIGYKGCPKEVHWGDKAGKPAKGTRSQNINYCTKDYDAQKEWATEIFGNLKPPRKIRFPVMDRWWQVDVLAEIAGEPDDRTIWWYWSEGGNLGKTTFCKYLTVHHEAVPVSGKGNDVRNAICTHLKATERTPELVVFPIPRSFDSEYVSYEAIENIKDMYFYSGKYEGGAVCGPCPHLFVFANFPPNESKMSADRWRVVNVDSK